MTEKEGCFLLSVIHPLGTLLVVQHSNSQLYLLVLEEMAYVENVGSVSTKPGGEVESQTQLDKGPQWAVLSGDSLALWPLETCISS